MSPRTYQNQFQASRPARQSRGGPRGGTKGPRIYAISAGTLKGVHCISPPCAPTLPTNHHHPITLHFHPSDFFALQRAHSPPQSPSATTAKEVQMRRFNTIEAAEAWLDSEETFRDEFDEVMNSLQDNLCLTPKSSPVSSKPPVQIGEDLDARPIGTISIERPRRAATPPPLLPKEAPTRVYRSFECPPSPPPSPPIISRRASDPTFASLPPSFFQSMESSCPRSPLSHADLLEGMIFSLRRRDSIRPSADIVVSKRRGIGAYAEVRRSSTGTVGVTLSTGRVAKVGSGRKWSVFDSSKNVNFFDWGVRKARSLRGNSGKRVVDLGEVPVEEKKKEEAVTLVGGDGMDLDD